MRLVDPPAIAPGLSPTILIVEDEVMVRLVLADHLRGCGYQVIEASHAGEVIQVLQADVPIDIVFIDVDVPGVMNGFGLARWIRRHKPEVQVILTSGHETALEMANELSAERLFLPKPYDLAKVADQARRLLNASPNKAGCNEPAPSAADSPVSDDPLDRDAEVIDLACLGAARDGCAQTR